MSEYRFNTKKIGHQFCKICGIESFVYGVGPVGAVNVNCLDGVDPRALKSAPYGAQPPNFCGAAVEMAAATL